MGFGELNERKKRTIDDQVEKVNGLTGWKKAVAIVPLVGTAGTLLERYQSKIFPLIGWSSMKGTLWNCATFGVLGSVQYYAFGEGGGYLASFIADNLGVAVEVVGNAVAAYNLIQTGIRAGYTLKTGKGCVSFSPMGIVSNAAYIPSRAVVNAVKKKKQKH